MYSVQSKTQTKSRIRSYISIARKQGWNIWDALAHAIKGSPHLLELEAQYLYSEQIEKYLDVGYGKWYLSKTEIAKLEANSFPHFDNVRYRLHAWGIMPNHVDVIVEAMPDNDLSKIIHSWKSYTAHRANEMLRLTGAFWQRDAYNHIIRSRKEYYFQIQYTWENPKKAGLRNWQWGWKTDNI